jgi:TRAP-type C4-dicarboxylate transport system permease small subunit
MSKFNELLSRAEMTVAKYALFALSALIFGAAVARTLRYPIAWAMDAATFLFAWCVFLGGDIAIRRDRLFCIVILSQRLSPRGQLLLKAVNYLIIALFLAGMIFYGSWLSVTTRHRAFQGMPGVSYTWVTLSVPIGCALMLRSSLQKVRESLRALRGGQGPAPLPQEGPTEVI